MPWIRRVCSFGSMLGRCKSRQHQEMERGRRDDSDRILKRSQISQSRDVQLLPPVCRAYTGLEARTPAVGQILDDGVVRGNAQLGWWVRQAASALPFANGIDPTAKPARAALPFKNPLRSDFLEFMVGISSANTFLDDL